jgi:hypothetical protein
MTASHLTVALMLVAIILFARLSNNVYSGVFSLCAAHGAFLSGLALVVPGSMAVAFIACLAAFVAAAISFFSHRKRPFYIFSGINVGLMAWYLYLTGGA